MFGKEKSAFNILNFVLSVIRTMQFLHIFVLHHELWAEIFSLLQTEISILHSNR